MGTLTFSGERTKSVGLGMAVGFVSGPLIGLWLIRISNVAYLETVFAFSRIALGIAIGFMAGMVIMTFLGEHLSRLRWNMIWGLLITSFIIGAAEIVIMLRRIIP